MNYTTIHIQVFAYGKRSTDWYGARPYVDYKGADVTAESFLRLLTGE